MSVPGLRARGFGWTYAGHARPALVDLDFELEPGSTLLVLGPSGSGKSTLARALAGLVPHVLPGAWQGQLEVGSASVEKTPAPQLARLVGICFQDPDSQLVMPRVEDEVAFGLENRGWAYALMHRRVPEVLAQVGLAGFERRSTAALSGGEQQRLAIGGLLAPAPGLLVFDEPTANLDPVGVAAVFGTLSELASRGGHTLVVVEHRVDAALPLADRVLILDDLGRQVAFGGPDDVGRRHASALHALGGWLPRAWRTWLPEKTSAPPARSATLTIAARRAPSTAPPTAPPVTAQPGQADRPVVVADAIGLIYPPSPSGPQRPALDGISLELRASERVALVGPNGSGKSSLLFVLAGIRRPTNGRVRITDGSTGSVDPADLPSGRLPTLLGLVLQDPELGFVAGTVAGEVAASLRGVATAERERRVAAALGRFGLSELAGRDPFRLSQGEQRRLSLAAAGVTEPRLLLLDEPTFGLDRRGSEAVLALLDELLASAQAQLLVTHDPRLLPGCSRVLALDAGRIVFDGSPEAFLAEPPYTPAEPWRDAVLGEWMQGQS